VSGAAAHGCPFQSHQLAQLQAGCTQPPLCLASMGPAPAPSPWLKARTSLHPAAEYDAAYVDMRGLAERAAKLEGKAKLVVAGLQGRTEKVGGEAEACWQQLQDSGTEEACFKALQVGGGQVGCAWCSLMVPLAVVLLLGVCCPRLRVRVVVTCVHSACGGCLRTQCMRLVLVTCAGCALYGHPMMCSPCS
jgi:hypothetical protein